MAIPFTPVPQSPYAPETLSSAPQMGMNIAQMMMQNSNEQANRRMEMFSQLGQGIAGAGQAVVGGMREQRLNQAQQIENQKNQMAVQGMKFQMEGHAALAK